MKYNMNQLRANQITYELPYNQLDQVEALLSTIKSNVYSNSDNLIQFILDNLDATKEYSAEIKDLVNKKKLFTMLAARSTKIKDFEDGFFFINNIAN